MTPARLKWLRRACLALAAVAPMSAQALELLVPGYFYPSTHPAEWQALVDTARQQPLSVIINPDSGPGVGLNPDYVRVIADLRAVGATLYGYVSTAWGSRALSQVTADLDRFDSLYDIDGFFLDEMATDADMLGHYQQISAHVASMPGAYLTIANPGTPPDEAYLALFDTLVTFESPASALGVGSTASYQADYSATRFAQLVYGVDASAMPSLLQQAAADNYGYVFVTDRDGAGAWEGLPRYWSAEAAEVTRVSAVPEPGPALTLLLGLVVVSGAVRCKNKRRI